MKKYISIGIAVWMLIVMVQYTPVSKAPLLETQAPLQASILQTPEPVTTPTPEVDQRTKTLLNLLEITVDQDRDFQKAQEIMSGGADDEATEKILQLYEAKILARQLSFEEAQKIINLVQDDRLNILKAAVYIALDDRDRAGNFLHQLAENHPDADTKAIALSLLNIYHTYDANRDADVSYLWTLFAQQLGELGEYEISYYLAEKAIERNPDYRDAWIIKGYNELTLKDAESAELSLLKAYSLDPGNAHIQYLLGLTYFALNDPEKSTQFLLYSKDSEPQYEHVILEKLAENAIKMEDYALASFYYETLHALAPENMNAISRLLWIYVEQLRDFVKADILVQSLHGLTQDEIDLPELKAWIEQERNNGTIKNHETIGISNESQPSPSSQSSQ